MQEIIDGAGLKRAMEASQTTPIFLFKHSTTCPISSAAYREVESYLDRVGEGAKPVVYLVKVIESRPVSNAIAAQTGVTHQSPQVILVNGEEAVWNASHSGIRSEAMEKVAGGDVRD